MKKTVKALAAAVCAAAIAGFSANAADFPEMKLSFAHTAATSHAHHQAAMLFAKEVSDMTGGKVQVQVYPAGELGDQPALLDQCFNGGDVDVLVASQSNMASYVPKLNALSAPFLFDSYDQAHSVIDSYVMPWMEKDVEEKMNMVPLGVFDYGFRHVTTKGIEVKKADDLKDVKIRVPGSAGLLATFDALGANTQTIAYSELYQSLKQGVVDAEENPVATILADSFYECQDNLALTGHFFDMQTLLINKDKFDAMSPELQKVIRKAGIDAQNLTRKLIPGQESEIIEKLKAKGMKVYDVDKQSFKDKMGPAYEKVAKLCGKEELDSLMKAIK
jgi:tripartite ATP-independent transporter DctP family solute receptor